MNEIFKVIKERRSTRSYKSDLVARELIDQVLEAGFWAPSGMNKQLWHFTVIESLEKSTELADIVGPAAEKGENYNFFKAPVVILVSYPQGERNAMQDCSAATQNMLLAAHALGLGTCWINQVQATSNDAKVRAKLTEFGVPENYDVKSTISLGYIDVETKAHPRKTENSVNYVK